MMSLTRYSHRGLAPHKFMPILRERHSVNRTHNGLPALGFFHGRAAPLCASCVRRFCLGGHDSRFVLNACWLIALALLFSVTTDAVAQSRVNHRTESRDKASNVIGAFNIAVNGVGQACLGVAKRPESLRAYVAVWQHRNARYLGKSGMYWSARLDRAMTDGGQKAYDALREDLNIAADAAGKVAMAILLPHGANLEACTAALNLIDRGFLDFGPHLPMYADLQGLLRWEY
jgi:hypothetical protein